MPGIHHFRIEVVDASASEPPHRYRPTSVAFVVIAEENRRKLRHDRYWMIAETPKPKGWLGPWPSKEHQP